MHYHTNTSLPFVTIIMPIRNESAYIQRSLGSVLAQDYPPERMEIIVVDGMSEDGTREVVKRIIEKIGETGRGSNGEGEQIEMARPYPSRRILLLDNPDRIVPTALNIGLRHAQGDIIIRVDGHCEIPPDYVRRCVEGLQKFKADCFGGQLETVGETKTAWAIALAQSSLFGVGSVRFRVGSRQPCPVDTVAFGAYRREVFERIGGFDEELMRNQDDEFNFRLLQAGGKIWLDPSLKVRYYSRSSWRRFWRQYFEYGLYKVRVIQKRGSVPSWRHLVPGAFVLGLIGSLLLALVMAKPLWALSVVGPYAVANLLASVWVSRRDAGILLFLPIAFATLHLAYGLGFLCGLWKWRNAWTRKENPAKEQSFGE